MLSRWPIRHKLFAALALLTAIVGTLAMSGFWGLYGYRQLATSVSERAVEIPISNQLTWAAGELRDACHRIRSGMETAYPIDAKLRSFAFSSENTRYHSALHSYRNTLERYQNLFRSSSGDTFILSDHSRSLAVLSKLQEQLDHIDNPKYQQLWTVSAPDLEALQSELAALSAETERLPELLHARMANLRNDVKGRYRAMITLAWLSLIASFLMVATLLWYFRKLVVHPFRNLLDGSRIVARGNLDHRIDLGTGDEFAELAGAMNEMTERFQSTYKKLMSLCENLDQQVRDRTREVVQSEQLASVGFLAAGVAHEINNPLAAIAWSAEAIEARLHDLLQSSAQLLADASDADPHDAELHDSIPSLSPDQIVNLETNLRRIQNEAFRCKGITERLLNFSRMGDLERTDTELTELVGEVIAMVRTLGQYRCKTIHYSPATSVCASVNGQQIKQVVLNLLTNALESVDTDGAVEVSVIGEQESVRIRVVDNGCGMTPEVLEHLFEPFFTKRRDGRGTGLGLSISYRIVNQHGGQITAASNGPGLGSSLEVLLPIQSASSLPVNHHASEERLSAA